MSVRGLRRAVGDAVMPGTGGLRGNGPFAACALSGQGRKSCHAPSGDPGVPPTASLGWARTIRRDGRGGRWTTLPGRHITIDRDADIRRRTADMDRAPTWLVGR